LVSTSLGAVAVPDPLPRSTTIRSGRIPTRTIEPPAARGLDDDALAASAA
jgi:hypothetical protein